MALMKFCASRVKQNYVRWSCFMFAFGKCTRKIIVKQNYVTCKNCTLDFHVECTDCDVNAAFWCDSCFHRVCHNELPFCNEPFIDFSCNLSKGFKIAHLNIQSVRYKVDHVRVLLNDNNIDILCITESWLDCNIS